MAFLFSLPVMTDPIDEVKSRGMSFTPDITGLSPSTIWKRCGRLKVAIKNVKPEQSVTLYPWLARLFQDKVQLTESYKTEAPITRSVTMTFTGKVTLTGKSG